MTPFLLTEPRLTRLESKSTAEDVAPFLAVGAMKVYLGNPSSDLFSQQPKGPKGPLYHSFSEILTTITILIRL